MIAFLGHPSVLANMIEAAYGNVLSTIQTHGDEVVVNGVYRWNNNPDGPLGLQIWASNTNNDQITYGFLGAAIDALDEYMTALGEPLTTYR